MSNIVAIVGRPNVGKSTFFNRLTESRQAIVDESSGVTRDRHYGKVIWNAVEFSIIDTGGYVIGSEDIFEGEIRKQVNIAIEEANIILFVVDVESGITEPDREVAALLRRSNKTVFLVVNKVDNNQRINDAYEFYNLGFENYHCISSINGSGSGDLLDEIVKALPEAEQEEEINIPRFAVVGRPNVGKSSFINALIGQERNIVTSIAGTTRDTINTRYNKFGLDFFIVDTAGIRKKAKVNEDLEFYSVMRSIRAIENCDVCILILDATQGIESQDLSIFSLAEKNRKGVVILVNKWDLVEKNTQTHLEYEEKIRARIAPFNDVPIIFTSVLTMQRIHKALEEAMHVYKNRNKRITTSQLNDIILPYIEATPPPSNKGKWIKVKFITQLPTHTPSFAFFCNLPQYVKDPYKRFIENKLREEFDFTGIPIQIFFRQK